MSYIPLTRPIVIRESITASENPTSGDISLGEIAINSADGNMFIKTTSDDIVQINGGGGGGSEPATQVVYGTGTGTTSSSYLKYDDTTNAFEVNSPHRTVPGTPGSVIINAYGGTTGPGGSMLINSGPGSNTGDFAGGTISLIGGKGGGESQGGSIELRSGVHSGGTEPDFQFTAGIEMSGAAGSGANITGGSIVIRAGDNGGTGSGGYVDIVLPDNALRINGNEGSSGQVLTSNGPNVAPTWENPPGPSVFPSGVWSGTLATYTLGTDGYFPGLSNLLNSDAVTYNDVTGAFTLVGGGTYSIMIRAVITSTDAADTGTTVVELALINNSWALPLNQTYNVTGGATSTTCILSGIIYGSNGQSATPIVYVPIGNWGTATTLSLVVDIAIVKLNSQQGV